MDSGASNAAGLGLENRCFPRQEHISTPSFEGLVHKDFAGVLPLHNWNLDLS